LDAAITGHFDRPVHGLLHVLIDKRREGILDNIVDEFERYLDLREGRTHVHVTSARGLDDELRQNIIDKLQAALGSKEIKLHEIVEPRIIGGLILKVGDRVLDGSIRRRLRGLASSLTSDS
jgi:F-type H+-transporting ATPase subunit delta